MRVYWDMGRFLARMAAESLPVFVGQPTNAEVPASLERETTAAGLGHAATWPWLEAAYGFLLEGRLEAARSALAHGHELLDRFGAVPTGEAWAIGLEALLHLRAGELDQALRSAAAAVAYARSNAPYPFQTGFALTVQAEALLAAGQPNEAEAAANEALHLNEDGSQLITQHARLVLAEALLRRRPSDASRQLEALLVEASAPATMNRLVQAQAWRLLGECRLALGQHGEALTQLQRALEEAERQQWPYMQVQAMLSLGRHHKVRRQFGRMQRVVLRALQLAQAQGYGELRRQGRQLGQFGVNTFAPLAELRRLLAHHGALDELIAHGLELARGLARADRAAIFLAGDDGLRLAGAFPAGVDPLLTGHELLEEVLRDRHTVWRQGVVSNRTGDWLVDAEVRSLLAVPLTSAGGASPSGDAFGSGVLYLDRRTAHEPFTRGEVAKLESLASYLALALDQALRARQAPAAEPVAEGRAARLEAAFAQLVEADRVRRGFLGAVSADLRHQLGALREALDAMAEGREGREVMAAALAHAERLAEILERGIRD
jgi:tetratricopeptide (TPR) repeat protein